MARDELERIGGINFRVAEGVRDDEAGDHEEDFDAEEADLSGNAVDGRHPSTGGVEEEIGVGDMEQQDGGCRDAAEAVDKAQARSRGRSSVFAFHSVLNLMSPRRALTHTFHYA